MIAQKPIKHIPGINRSRADLDLVPQVISASDYAKGIPISKLKLHYRCRPLTAGK